MYKTNGNYSVGRFRYYTIYPRCDTKTEASSKRNKTLCEKVAVPWKNVRITAVKTAVLNSPAKILTFQKANSGQNEFWSRLQPTALLTNFLRSVTCTVHN